MKLKRLDIHGFKSFYHRTTLAFDEGITAVVGPNGCGKSNIVDSIKWVMGEQGPKSLRGSAMEDVVFAGSERRGPMGMCEVRLTFVNDGRTEVPARWQEVEELAIERRLERSKGSDYFINKQRARLADIQELVAGSGVGSGPGGRRAYAIIEQGRIGRIVGARAEERRLLIEEAAGITRYRDRRRVAERKMEETRLNLERIEDVVDEVGRQLRSLKRQARKAERYAAYRDEARAIGLRAAVFELLDRRRALAERGDAVEKAEAARADALRAVDAAEAKQMAAAVVAKATDNAARTASEKLSAAEGDEKVTRARLESLEREAAGLARQREAARTDLEHGTSRLAQLQGRLAAAEARLAELGQETEGADDGLAEREAEREAAQKALAEARERAIRLRREEAEEARAVERARSALTAATSRVEHLRERLERAAGEVDALTAQRGAADARLAATVAAVAEAESAVEQAQAEAARAKEARAEARQALDAAHAEERRLAEERAAVKSRLTSLEELEKRREGVGEGAKAVLKARVEGVRGTVPEVLEVPRALEQAVAAALGDVLSGLLVDDLAAAGRGIDVLRQRGKGRAVFASVAAEAPPEPPPPPTGPGVRGLLVDLLPAGAHPALLARLTGETLVVDDRAAALRVAHAGEWRGPIVTVEGERLDGGAVLSGGAEHGGAAPLGRRREIKALRAQLDALEAAIEAAREGVAEARAATAAARTALDDAGRAVHAAELKRTETRKDRHRAEADQRRIVQAVERADAAQANARAEIEAAEAARAEAAEASRVAEGARVDRHRAIAEAEEDAQRAEARRDEAVSTLHQARTAAVARRTRLEAAREEVRRLADELQDVKARTERAETGRRELEARLSELSGLRVEAERALADAQAAAAELATTLGAARAKHEDAQAAFTEAGERTTAARKAADAAGERLNQAQLARQEGALRVEHLQDALAERYQTTVAEAVRAHAHGEPPTEAERARLEELEALLERIGDVNPGAIEAHREAEERFEFLETQRTDLLDALRDLQRAIEQMNRTSRALFAETFEAVNAGFKVLFPRLFRGGEARLELTDPDDLLETGIEMLVQPPGKKVQSVTLLSGGEKAMCAIALVFAVFQHKPSPFCLLDEVDAPLDDANIGRFNEIVREIAQTSQVVLITHNKRTMEIADVLYGITMEEAGISKLVSVRMT